MKAVVGIDRRATDQGVIRFATWLCEALESGCEAHGIRIVPELVVSSLVGEGPSGPVLESATAVAREGVAEAGGAAAFKGAEAWVAPTVVEGLARAARFHKADAILIGRLGPAGRPTLVRLGQVARRLLRALPRPTLVVPPDFDPVDLSGPVLLGTSLRDDCDGAARFATAIAKDLGRPLHVVHVFDDFMARWKSLPGEGAQQIHKNMQYDIEEAFGAWLTAHDLQSATTTLIVGDNVSQLSSIAEEKGSPLVVVGSRLLSAAARVFISSTASTLAAQTARPVAIVPPDSRAYLSEAEA